MLPELAKQVLDGATDFLEVAYDVAIVELDRWAEGSLLEARMRTQLREVKSNLRKSLVDVRGRTEALFGRVLAAEVAREADPLKAEIARLQAQVATLESAAALRRSATVETATRLREYVCGFMGDLRGVPRAHQHAAPPLGPVRLTGPWLPLAGPLERMEKALREIDEIEREQRTPRWEGGNINLRSTFPVLQHAEAAERDAYAAITEIEERELRRDGGTGGGQRP